MKKIGYILFFSCVFVKSTWAFTVDHDFDVFIGSFNASRTNFSYALSEKDYRIKSDVKTYGIFDKLYPFQAIYETTGKLVGEDLQTQSYKYRAKSRFNTRTKELVYDEQGNPIYRLSSKNEKQKKVDIDQAKNEKGTTDLQTVIAELVLQYNRFRFCDSKMEVFDGKRRYDVVFKDEGKEVLNKHKSSPYQGEAVKCSMYIDSLGEVGNDMLWELSSDKPVYFWVLEDEQGHPFIARIEIKSTPYGKLSVFARNVKIEEDN
ncbi:MAG: DUF3108 domain-containing protein [Alphaproteobacteria bacterium]|nr:DUF3108 domain-containing protein [Alphaproteobacteria bacterium]